MKALDNNLFFEEVKRIISEGASVEILVRGKSMTPYLKDGIDTVVIAPFEPSELKKGDVVLFFNANGYFLHRIIKRKGNSFTIQGDGVVKKQEETSLSDIIGIVRFVIRRSGRSVSVNRWSHIVYWKSWLFFRTLRRYLLVIYRLF